MKADWFLIEADYRAGIKPLRQMAAEHGITEGAIRKKAKKEDWQRDLTAKISAKADQLVRNSEVRNEVRKEKGTPEREVVEANATTQANVRLSQRSDVVRSRKLTMKLFAELEAQTDNTDLLELLKEIRTDGEKDSSKVADLFNRVTSLSGRTDTMKKLSDALKTLITLESQVYGIADGTSDDENKRNVEFKVIAVRT